MEEMKVVVFSLPVAHLEGAADACCLGEAGLLEGSAEATHFTTKTASTERYASLDPEDRRVMIVSPLNLVGNIANEST